MDLHHQVRRFNPVVPHSHSNLRTTSFANAQQQQPSIPIGIPAFVIAWASIPRGFPHQNLPDHEHKKLTPGQLLFSRSSLRRVDVPGTILILLATVALTAAFEEADKTFAWRSAYVITLLTAAGCCWLALVLWERYIVTHSANTTRESILPWAFLTNRAMVGILL